MTSIVPTPAAPDVPQYPALGSANFNQDAYAYGSAMPQVSYRIWEIASAAQQNAQTAAAAAEAATNAVAGVQNAAAIANMRGAWSELSGALATPASVYHDNRYWALLRPIASVSASEPGVSADWALISSVTDEILAVMHAINLAR